MPPIPIPANLLVECLPPEIDGNLNYEGSLILNEQLLDVVEICNKQLRAIAEVEQVRANQPDKAPSDKP